MSFPRKHQSGFGYLLMLFALAAMGVVLAGLGQTWAQTAQRERETELIFIGQQFSQALLSYRTRTPAGQPDMPQTIEELLEDTRFPYPVRHLRRLYADPISGNSDWGLEIAAGRIIGVHSNSQKKPIREHLPKNITLLAEGTEHPTYSTWRFRPPTKEVITPASRGIQQH